MTGVYVSMAVVVLAWGSYPLVVRSTGVGGPVGALLLTLAALLPIVTANLWQGGNTKLSIGDWVRFGIAGVIMGMGTTAFNFLVNDRRVDASIAIPMVNSGMLLVTMLGALWFYAEPASIRKLLGVALILAGMFVLRPS